MWSLTIRSPDGKPQEFMIVKPKMSLGRRADNDIVIADISASRLHAEIQYLSETDTLTIRDLGSMNGTFVNREKLVETHNLSPQDVIRIGEHVINVTHFHSSV